MSPRDTQGRLVGRTVTDYLVSTKTHQVSGLKTERDGSPCLANSLFLYFSAAYSFTSS